MHDVSERPADVCESGVSIRCVLVPTDFSEGSHAALSFAITLVQRCGASLHLLHVVEELSGPQPLGPHVGIRSELARAIERSVWDDLRQQLSDRDSEALHVQMALEWGTPGVEILRYANAHRVDLIAMGKTGRGALAHLLMGRVAENVVRNAPCAVLSVDPPRRAAQQAGSSM